MFSDLTHGMGMRLGAVHVFSTYDC